MGPALHKTFQDAGLPAPHMLLEMELAADLDFVRWTSDSLKSVLPEIQRFKLPFGQIGDVDTLQDRLQKEVAESNSVAPWIGLVGAFCNKR